MNKIFSNIILKNNHTVCLCRAQQDCHGRTSSSLLMTRVAFTLAEVLITLAIIGVVAAMAIPSVISNAQQQEFKTGLKKAVSVLNSAITMNIALDGESPYDNANLFGYLQKHMSIMSSFTNIHIEKYYVAVSKSNGASWGNAGFYTTDGMRFEFASDNKVYNKQTLYENPDVKACMFSTQGNSNTCGKCGSYGLANNPDNTTAPPCLITVDVNGDRKPNPTNVNCKNGSCSKENVYKMSSPNGKKLTDVFPVMITDSAAIPYGVAAQKAMYSAQK